MTIEEQSIKILNQVAHEMINGGKPELVIADALRIPFLSGLIPVLILWRRNRLANLAIDSEQWRNNEQESTN